MRRIAVAVVVLLGVFAVDCCNATADAAWSDLSRAPHVAAVRVTTPVVAQHEDGPGASLPAPVPTLLLVLVLLFVLSADRRLRWSSALATGPPRRGPPSLPVLRSLHALESLEMESWTTTRASSCCDGPMRSPSGNGWRRRDAPGCCWSAPVSGPR